MIGTSGADVRTRLTTGRASAQIGKGCCGVSLAYQAWYGGPFVRFGSRDACPRYQAKPVHQVSIPFSPHKDADD
jgi:hypothetical protein